MPEEAKSAGFGPVMARTAGMLTKLLTEQLLRRPPRKQNRPLPGGLGAGATGLEPATSGVTGRRSNQLNYAPDRGAV